MRLRILASTMLVLLACAPAHATTPLAGPPASADVQASTESPSTSEVPVRGRDASWPTPVSGALSIDVGNAQSLHVSKSGRVTLDDVVLQSIDGDAVHGYHLIVDKDEATLTLGLGDAKGVNLLRVMKIDLEHQRLAWHVVVGANLGFDNEAVNWRVVETRNRLMLVEDQRVVAIDSRTGEQAWHFRLLTPDFRREYFKTISPTLTKFFIEDAGVRGRELVLAARLGEDRETTMVELDVDSGRRVYIQSRRDAPVQTKLGEFAEPDLGAEPRTWYDDPPPPPPPVPLRVEGWDGVAVGTTVLVWNVATKRGLIVNPMHDALGEVLARAKALPVKWVGVVDTRSVADSIVARGKTFPLATKPSKAQFEYGLVATDSVDFVDAAALAHSLDVPAITTLDALPKDATIRFEYEPDVYTSIRLLWGPFSFHDSNRPEGFGNYVTRL